MRFTLFATALVAMTIPTQLSVAVPINAVADVEADADSVWGDVKRKFISLENYCHRKLAVDAKRSTNLAELVTGRTIENKKYFPKGKEGWSAEIAGDLDAQAKYLTKQAECAATSYGKAGDAGVLFTTQKQCKEAHDRIHNKAHLLMNDFSHWSKTPTQKISAEKMEAACNPEEMAWLVSDL